MDYSQLKHSWVMGCHILRNGSVSDWEPGVRQYLTEITKTRPYLIHRSFLGRFGCDPPQGRRVLDYIRQHYEQIKDSPYLIRKDR